MGNSIIVSATKIMSAALVAAVIVAGCGDSSQGETAKNVSQPTAPTKADYLSKLSEIGLKDRLTLIGDYGPLVQSTDWYDQTQASDMQKLGTDMIAKYEELHTHLGKIVVPSEQKEFHGKLVKGVAEFIDALKEMDVYAKDVTTTDNLTKALAHYLVSTNTLTEVAKDGLYKEIK